MGGVKEIKTDKHTNSRKRFSLVSRPQEMGKQCPLISTTTAYSSRHDLYANSKRSRRNSPLGDVCHTVPSFSF
ncbi:Uncharacterized protein APZ42_023008 [Daphnia magna]|uniref:Uncharacterized protein n=1 Tax=Daphnia magna TaxID=35525 RepID=A0A164VC00_9CRUS|nr:Uncharacterized protein APZ42_023008 [Daphnia magna]